MIVQEPIFFEMDADAELMLSKTDQYFSEGSASRAGLTAQTAG